MIRNRQRRRHTLEGVRGQFVAVETPADVHCTRRPKRLQNIGDRQHSGTRADHCRASRRQQRLAAIVIRIDAAVGVRNSASGRNLLGGSGPAHVAEIEMRLNQRGLHRRRWQDLAVLIRGIIPPDRVGRDRPTGPRVPNKDLAARHRRRSAMEPTVRVPRLVVVRPDGQRRINNDRKACLRSQPHRVDLYRQARRVQLLCGTFRLVTIHRCTTRVLNFDIANSELRIRGRRLTLGINIHRQARHIERERRKRRRPLHNNLLLHPVRKQNELQIDIRPNIRVRHAQPIGGNHRCPQRQTPRLPLDMRTPLTLHLNTTRREPRRHRRRSSHELAKMSLILQNSGVDLLPLTRRRLIVNRFLRNPRGERAIRVLEHRARPGALRRILHRCRRIETFHNHTSLRLTITTIHPRLRRR